MRSCDINLVPFLNSTSAELPEDGVLFHCPYISLAIEDGSTLEHILNAAHRVLLNIEEEEEGQISVSADNITRFCSLLASLKPIKYSDFLNSLQYLISLLPSVENLADNSTFSRCHTFQYHVWLILSSTRVLVAAKYLPGSLDTYWNILDNMLGSMLVQSLQRVAQTKESALTLVSEKRALFNPPQTFANCECVEATWKFLITKICEVSAEHTASDLKFWDLFNKHFNTFVCTSDNISGMIWTVEQIGGLVKSVSPGLPPNWSVVQELTKLSCVNPSHLRQTLVSLSALGDIWQTNIVIVMTLQQHFARSLNAKSSGLIPVLSPNQYVTISESIVKRSTLSEDNLFQHFLLFYCKSLEKLPDVKKVTLIRRLFQSEKLDHKCLSTMSAEGLQNLGLLVACCVFLTKSDCLTAQVNKIFGSLSGDMISNSTSPNVIVSLQIGMTLTAIEGGLDSQLLLEQLTIMLNRISEDYIRETDPKKCQIFGVFSKMLNDLECLAGVSKFDSVMFLGTWVEMFLTEGDPQRCEKVFKFCQFVIDKADMNDISLTMINKFVVQPVKKFLKSRNQELRQCFDVAIGSLASFLLKLQLDEQEKHKNICTEILAMVSPPSCTFSVASEFLYLVLKLSKVRKLPQKLEDYRIVMANVVFNELCRSHIKPPETGDSEQREKTAVSIECFFNCPEFGSIIPELLKLNPQKENMVFDFFTIIKRYYQTMDFSDGQLFKNFVWKMFEGIPETLTTTLVGLTPEDGRCKRLYQLVAQMFEQIPSLLYNPSRPNSPILILFQTFFLKREQQNKRHMFQVLPKVFCGLSSLSYRSNNLFLKDISKVFDDVYTHVADRDWTTRKDDPFLVSLFRFSFADEVEDCARQFRFGVINHIADPNSGHCKLPKSADQLIVLLFFIEKLEKNTKDSAILENDFTKLYPFLLQVLFFAVKDTSPKDIKSLVSEILKYLNDQTRSSAVDLSSATESFINKNINSSSGPLTLVKTFQCLLKIGADKIVANSLLFLENALNGRANNEFILLRNEIFNRIP